VGVKASGSDPALLNRLFARSDLDELVHAGFFEASAFGSLASSLVDPPFNSGSSESSVAISRRLRGFFKR
jgi:hypothetical protein